MKGISSIIATLLMLIVTIGLAALAYGYIMGIWGSRITQTFQVVEVYNDTVTIMNSGSNAITELKGTISSSPMDAVLQVTPIDSSLVAYWRFDAPKIELVKQWSYPDYSGWSNPTTSTCGSWNMMGGYCKFGAGAYTQTSLNLEAGSYRICFDWIKGDSWDGEYGRFYFDGNLVWQKQYTGGLGTQVCGRTESGWNELRENVCVDVYHPGGTATLNFTSTLNQDAWDEWWGVDNIVVYKYRVSDDSDNGNDGNLVNGPTWVDGKFGKALSFDGVDDYVSINPQQFSLPSYTISAWLYPLIKGQGNIQGIIRLKNGTHELRLFINPSDIEHDIVPGEIANIVSPFDTNQWSLITVTFDGATVKIYRNGILQRQTNADMRFLNINSIEISWLAANKYFNGTIDEVRIYNRALSEEEIKAHASSNVGVAIMPGQTAKVKVLNVPSKGGHTLKLCTPNQCQTIYLTII